MNRLAIGLLCALYLPACSAPATTAPDPMTPTTTASCSDGQRNGDETAADCGGSCGACGNGLACAAASDCQSGRCAAGVCAAQPAALALRSVSPNAGPTSGGLTLQVLGAGFREGALPSLLIDGVAAEQVELVSSEELRVKLPQHAGVLGAVDVVLRGKGEQEGAELSLPAGFRYFYGTVDLGAVAPVATGDDAAAAGAVLLADLDGDALQDVVTLLPEAGAAVIMLRRADGFGAAARIPLGGRPAALGAGDVNGDNKADLVVADRGGDALLLLLGKGDGTFGDTQTIALPAGAAPAALVLRDLDRDGILDVAAAGGDSAIYVLGGKGDGTFGDALRSDAGAPILGLAAADLDRDGALDLFAAAGAGGVLSLRGQGDGTFSAPAAQILDAEVTALTAADLDGDGVVDVVAAAADGTVRVLLGGGDGALGAARSTAAGATPVALAVADLDLDGYVDVAAARADGKIAVLRGVGAGALAEAVGFSAVAAPQGLALSPPGSDGQRDVLISSGTAGTIGVLRTASY